MKKALLLALTVFVLTGCSGMSYAAKNYGGIQVEPWQHDGRKWRIFDKPRENRLMITASFGSAVVQGLGEGLTLGAVNMDHPGNMYRNATVAWLSAQGRKCEAKSVSLIVSPQWEVEYECDT